VVAEVLVQCVKSLDSPKGQYPLNLHSPIFEPVAARMAARSPLEELMKRTSPLLMVGLVAAALAQAQTQAPPSTAPQPSGWEAALKAVMEACKKERPQLCPDMSEATAVACLQSNIDKLTPACKDSVMNAAKSVLNF